MKNKILLFYFFVIVCFFASASIGYTKGSYKRYSLPYGISVEIPIGWEILNTRTNRQLDNMAEALSGIDQSNNEILLAANCYTSRKTASALFRISYRNKSLGISQKDLREWSEVELTVFNQIAIEQCKKINQIFDANIPLTSVNSKLVYIDNLAALNTDKITSATGFPGQSSLYIIPLGNGTLKINSFYDIKQKVMFEPIIKKILSSIRITKN